MQCPPLKRMQVIQEASPMLCFLFKWASLIFRRVSSVTTLGGLVELVATIFATISAQQRKDNRASFLT